jgi:cytochrome b561
MPGRYSGVALALHWLIALLVIGNIAGGHLFELFEDSADPGRKAIGGTIIFLHMSFGLTVLALTLVRLGWRLYKPPPPLPGYMTVFERRAVRWVHWGFYLLLFALPFSGWAMLSTARMPESVPWFGLFTLPWLPLPPGLHGLFHESHEALGWAMVVLIALHVGATLKHQVFDRDNLLARMLPRL